MRKIVLILLLLLGGLVLAAPLTTKLYRINYRWLLWTPLWSEVTVYPVDDPNNIEYHATVEQWLDPNCTFMHVDVRMPEHGDRDRIIELKFRVRRIEMAEFAEEMNSEK